MYLRALLENWSLAETPRDPELRCQLEREVSEKGAPILHLRLQELDPVTAARLHPNDAMRIVRALEVYLVSHVPLSEHLRRDQSSRPQRNAVRIGLTMPREMLYTRIERRVDHMLQQGFEQEVRSLLSRGFADTLPPMRSLGYKELALYIDGKLNFDNAVCLIKQNTRRYAKRQQTWFRADPALRWIDMSALSSAMAADVITESLHSEMQVYT
jgi:tRNA dimethylallyltransferase